MQRVILIIVIQVESLEGKSSLLQHAKMIPGGFVSY